MLVEAREDWRANVATMLRWLLAAEFED